MKKMLLLCTGLFLAAGIASAQVTSANIVGYLNTKAKGKYFATGPTFVNVGHTVDSVQFPAVWHLGDVKPKGMNPYTDIVQFLNPATSASELSATYIDEEWALDFVDDPDDPEEIAFWVGWWRMPNFTARLDNKEFPASTAVLSSFISPNVSFTYAGEVLLNAHDVTLEKERYPLVANFQPVTNKLGKIKVTGMNPYNDIFQVLNSTTTASDLTATYIDEEWALDFVDDPDDPEEIAFWVGWWRMPNFTARLDNYELAPGAALLGNIKTTTPLTLKFPSPLIP